MRTILVDLGRLVILILLLPLFIIFIGPLLVLTVFRGQQRVGPITLDTSHYDFAGRVGIFMLGLAIWLLVWSGLAWLAVAATAPTILVQIPQVSPDNTASASVPTSSATPLPATPTVSTSVPTPGPSTPQPTQTPVVSASADAATSMPTSTLLVGETVVTDAPTVGLSATQTATASQATTAVTETPGPTPQSAPTTADRQAAITAVEEANTLLRDAIALPSEENLANLGTFWQDRALIKVEKFAAEQYQKYTKPFNAKFEFITPPTISDQLSPNRVVITSRERWSYGHDTRVNQEAFEFIYTLNWQNGQWIITQYTYRNLPLSTPTTISQDGLGTATPGTAQN